MPPELEITQRKLEEKLVDQIPDNDFEFTNEDDLKVRKDFLIRHQESLTETLSRLEGELGTYGEMLPENEMTGLKDDIVKAKVFIGTNKAEIKKIDEKIAVLQNQSAPEVQEIPSELPTNDLKGWKIQISLLEKEIARMKSSGVTYSDKLFELEERKNELEKRIQEAEGVKI